MSEIPRFTFILFLVNLVAASLLVGVNNLTSVRIEELKKVSERESIEEVMSASFGEFLEPVEEEGVLSYIRVYKDKNKSVFSGYIFTAKQYGYSSVIETIVGMEKDGKILGIKILSQSETPGLGAKIMEKTFYAQFKGKAIENLVVVKTKTKDKIEAITSATISSKAVTDSIRQEAQRILDVERKR